MNWKIEEKTFDVENIASEGSRFLNGNGYLGIRGAMEEYDKSQLVAINLAGIYDQVPGKWREPLNAPNCLYTFITIDGKKYALPEALPKEHEVCLDYRNGIFSRKTIFETEKGKVTIQSEHFASMENVHLIALSYKISLDFQADVEITTGIDGNVWDINGPHYETEDFQMLEGRIELVAVIQENHHQVCVMEDLSTDFHARTLIFQGKDQMLRKISFESEARKIYKIEKVITVYTSNDCNDFLRISRSTCNKEKEKGFEIIKNEHIKVWESLWEKSQIIIDSEDNAMELLNYSIYHLHCIAPRHSKSMSIPARGLSGQTYKGAVFWDTEMFMLDFYLYTEPNIARTIIKYRIDTLTGAKQKAEEYGYQGAFYAWESQEGGFDACSDYNVTDVFTMRPMRTFFRDKQVHISAAVVYGIAQYLTVTDDISILEEGGIETILECALFYESLLLKKVLSNRYEIHDVIGPDEYHERVNNNGYTNRMAKFTFEKAMEVIEKLDSLSESTIERVNKNYNIRKLKEQFHKSLENLYIPQPDKQGIIEQFDGYHKLEDVTVEIVKSRLLHEKEYWGGAYGVASHTKIIKQADVVTWLNLFPDDFDKEVMIKNWNYYEPRTEHGSSLSACMYAMLACKCGMKEKAYPFFIKSAGADYYGGGKEWAGLIYIGGTHPAAAGGAYMTAIKGFAGIYVEEDKIKANPQLPKEWKSMEFQVCHQGTWYKININGDNASVMEQPDMSEK